jgi:hypothetical protein
MVATFKLSKNLIMTLIDLHFIIKSFSFKINNVKIQGPLTWIAHCWTSLTLIVKLMLTSKLYVLIILQKLHKYKCEIQPRGHQVKSKCFENKG